MTLDGSAAMSLSEKMAGKKVSYKFEDRASDNFVDILATESEPAVTPCEHTKEFEPLINKLKYTFTPWGMLGIQKELKKLCVHAENCHVCRQESQRMDAIIDSPGFQATNIVGGLAVGAGLGVLFRKIF